MFIIAYYTFIEYLRKKILYIIAGIWFVLMIATIIAWWLALSEQAKVIRDFWMWLIEIAGIVLVLFFGANVLQQEISQNTIFLLASKNIKRSNIILGKFFGFSLVILVFIAMMWLLYRWITGLYRIPFAGIHMIALTGIVVKLEVLLALCLLFASFVSPFVALSTSLVIYFLGHILSFVVYYTTILKKDIFNPLISAITKMFYYILPNFTSLSVQDFFDVPYLSSHIWGSFGFAVWFHILYVIVLLFIAVRIFNKRQF